MLHYLTKPFEHLNMSIDVAVTNEWVNLNKFAFDIWFLSIKSCQIPMKIQFIWNQNIIENYLCDLHTEETVVITLVSKWLIVVLTAAPPGTGDWC